MASIAKRPFLTVEQKMEKKLAVQLCIIFPFIQCTAGNLLKFLKLAFVRLVAKIGHTTSVGTEVTVVIDSANGEENLSPSQGRNGIKGSDAVGDFRAWKTRRNVPGEAEKLRDDVSNDSQLSHTAVFQLARAVLVERRLVNVLGQTERIKESSGCDNTNLVFVRVQRRRGNGLLLRNRSKRRARRN